MGKKENRRKHDDITVILGEGSKLTGKFEFEGVSRIDGDFNGEIESSNTLVIGESAKVKATIKVGKLILEGKVEGDIFAKTEILIHPSGKLYGNIETPALIIEKGGVFEGNSKMSIKKDDKKDIDLKKLKK